MRPSRDPRPVRGPSSRRCGALAAVLAVALALGAQPRSFALDGAGEGLQVRIDRAIDRGREHLLERLAELLERAPEDYPMGRLALPLAACLKAGAATNDPRVRAALAKLWRMPLRKTYSVACFLFALDALARRQYKESLYEDGSTGIEPGNARGFRARGPVLEKMVELIDWLVEARALGMGYWTYGSIAQSGPHNHDFSNTQFAVLGLQIGLEHGVPIPREVFEEIGRQFVRAQNIENATREFTITYSLSLRDLLKARGTDAAERGFRARPGGWGYTAERKDTTHSMTAAGASCLLVARNGMRGASLDLVRAVEAAATRAYAWILGNFDAYLALGRGAHSLYALYSLEKVGDLGEIERFGARDWYVEGAERLLSDQRPNGSWGSYVDTSFALFFLTRATRMKPFSAPRITTSARGDRGEDLDPDLVYISRLDGFLSARDVLSILAESRDPDLVPVGEEVAGNYSLEHRPHLVPQLLELWTRRPDRVTRFARSTLAEITGFRSSRRESYAAWYEDYQRIAALAETSSVKAGEVAELFRKVEHETLKSALVDLARRHDLVSLAGVLVSELSSPSQAYRLKVNGLLNLWSGRSVLGPPEKDEAGWRQVAEDWKAWAVDGTEDLLAARRVADLLRRLDAAPAAEAGGIRSLLVAIGKAAIPHLRRAVARQDVSFHAIEALEELSGESVGLVSPR